MNALHRNKLKLAGLLALSLAGCAAGRAAPPQPNEVQITGALTRRGGQIESFWGVRDTSQPDGKLWRIEAPNDAKSASITEQMTRFQQKTVRVTGEIASDGANAASPFPVLRVLKIELVTP